MEKNDNGILYLNMSIGTIGLNLLVFGFLMYVKTNNGDMNSFIVFMGFPLTMIYLNYLEAKAGINKKVLWIRSILSILMLLIIASFFIL
ncbi:hypothetical protein [Psychrobacillus sp. L4]|uniref:hypothetical protein n=1 Tax=Psychrobacillus sp. L4 TaxID=3236892 RepID=UPI0036F3F711